MTCPLMALPMLVTLSAGVGTFTVNCCHGVSDPSACSNRAHNVSLPAAVPASNTILATLAGVMSISWPPVCATPLILNCPPVTVPFVSHSSSLL